MSVEFYRESPGKFDSRTLSRTTLNRWTGRMCSNVLLKCIQVPMSVVWKPFNIPVALRMYHQHDQHDRRLMMLSHVVGLKPIGLESRSQGFCLCRTSSMTSMAAEESDCMVQVVSAFSDEGLCILQLPRSCTVLDVKRRLQATLGVNVFRQRLIVSPEGPEAEDREVLAALPGLRLQLIKLEYADDDTEHVLRAAEEGAASEVERLLRLPLRPDCGQAEDGATALMLASENGNLEVVRLLCEAGADKDKADKDGFTALILASSRGHLDVARLLCEAGADKDKGIVDGHTALIWASASGHLEVVRMLCEAGAN